MRTIRQLSVFLRGIAALLLVASATVYAQPAGTVTYIHNDLLGSPVAATNAAGMVIWRESFSGYGERTNVPADTLHSPRAANKVWYTSRHQDEDTGLVYMGARYYDPALGRFLSVDPVHFVETNVHSFNRYAYANNNPYRFRDPDGKQAIPAVLVTGAVLVAGGAYIANCDGCKQSASQAWDQAKEFARGIFNESDTKSGDASSAGDKDASTPTGQPGSPMDVKPGTNKPTTIGGRDYTGHALDQAQGRGVPPSAVEDAIQNGGAKSGNKPNTTVHTGENGVTVVTGVRGQVITIIPK